MLRADSSGKEIQAFFDSILRSTDEFALMKAEMQKGYPIFAKSPTPTHLVFKETRYLGIVENLIRKSPDTRILTIVRNPLSVLASWMLAPREFAKGWDIHREWRDAPSKNRGRPEEFFGYKKWKETAEAFLRFSLKYPEQFKLVSYAELNQAPGDTTRRLFGFCGLKMCDQVEDFLSASKSRHDADPYSVYRAKANDNNWQGVLPAEIVTQIASELKHTPLERFLQDDI